MSQDLTLENIHFRIECFDLDGNPMICNTDGESTFFEGDYPFVLAPYERTAHGAFRFTFVSVCRVMQCHRTMSSLRLIQQRRTGRQGQQPLAQRDERQGRGVYRKESAVVLHGYGGCSAAS